MNNQKQNTEEFTEEDYELAKKVIFRIAERFLELIDDCDYTNATYLIGLMDGHIETMKFFERQIKN